MICGNTPLHVLSIQLIALGAKYGTLCTNPAGVVELVYTHDSKSCGASLEGSSPSSGTADLSPKKWTEITQQLLP